MDIELKNKWLAALRSGQYTQTQGMLKSCESGFCCLGVLADIMEDAKWSPETTYPGQNSIDCKFSINGDTIESDEDLPWNVAVQLGLDKKVMAVDPIFPEDGEFETDLMSYLMSLNDTHKWDFNKIADYIEENL